MRLNIFSRDRSNECDNHHFGEWEETDEFKIRRKLHVWEEDGEYKGWTWGWNKRGIPDERTTIRAFSILRRKRRTCLHHGCDEVQERWNDYRIIPLENLEDVGYEPQAFKEYL